MPKPLSRYQSMRDFGDTPEPVVGLITEWMSPEGLQKRTETTDLGGTMRLGAYEASLGHNSHVAAIYGSTSITAPPGASAAAATASASVSRWTPSRSRRAA